MVQSWWKRFARRGFVGPRFEGVVGRLRFAFQEFVVHREILLVASPETVAARSAVGPHLEMDVIRSFGPLESLAGTLDGEYYPGFTQRFRAPFTWGETLVLLRAEGHVVGFRWYQKGTASGVRYHAGTLLPGDYRILRGGVLPSQRRRGYSTALHILLLHALFEDGARRVFVDVSEDNIPSVKALTAAGYVPIGRLTVLGRLFGGFIRWEK